MDTESIIISPHVMIKRLKFYCRILIGMSSSTEKVRSVLTPTFVTILVILSIFSLLVGITTENLAGPYVSTEMGWFVPYIWIVLIVEVAAKYNPKFRLNSTQYIIFILLFSFAASHAYITSGISTLSKPFEWMELDDYGAYGLGQMNSHTSWLPALMLLPSYVFPHNLAATNIFVKGLQPGQTIPWGVVAGPIAFWSIYDIVAALMTLSFAFIATGPEWTEERVIFPMYVPAIYMVNSLSTRDDKGKSSLLSLNVFSSKVFWIMFVIGLIIGSTIGTLALLPMTRSAFAPWMTTYLDYMSFSWGSFIAPVMPGAFISPSLEIMEALIMIILPYEVMVTMLITWLAVPMLYEFIAVKAGWVTYVVGSENNGMYVYGSEAPFPYYLWANTGLAVGVGLYFAWKMRKRIKKALLSVLGPSQYENGFNVKKGAWLFIGSVVAFFVLELLMGANWFVAIVWLILFFIWQIAVARVNAEVWWDAPTLMYTWWQLYFPIGAGLGIWQNVPAQNSRPLVAQNVINQSMGSGGALFDDNLNLGYETGLYKWAHDTHANLRDVFNWTIILTVITMPISAIFLTWLVAHVSWSNAAAWSGWEVWNAMAGGITSTTNNWYAGETYAQVWGWTVLGVAFVWILMFLRSAFPWFMFSPVAMLVALVYPPSWINAAIGLVFKFGFNKTLGAKRTQDYVIPSATGLMMGIGAFDLFSGLYVWITYILPRLFAVWKP